MTQVDLDKIYPSATPAAPASPGPSEQQPSNSAAQPNNNNPAKSISGYGKASLIVGIITLIATFAPMLLASGALGGMKAGSYVGLLGFIVAIPILAPICVAAIFGGPLACGILFLVSLSEVSKNKLDSSYLSKPIIGLVLSLLPILGYLFLIK